MRIIYLHPHFTSAGGAGRAVLETGKRLARRGHDVHCICIRADQEVLSGCGPGIQFHEIGGPLSSQLTFWARFRAVCASVNAAAGEILSKNPRESTILYPQVFPANWWASYILNKRPSLPCVWYCQEPSAFIHSPDWINALPWPKNWLARLLNPVLKSIDSRHSARFSKVLVNSDYSRSAARQVYGFDEQQCEKVYLGVDHARFSVCKQTPRHPWITTIAKLTDFKNVDKLILATGRLVSEGMSALQLQVIGTGDAVASLRSLARRHGLEEHIHFHGRVEDAQMVKVLRSSRVFCLASEREPFGLVTVEALACGTPVVAVDSGGPGEIVSGFGCGKLVECADPPRLASALRQVLESGDDFDCMSAAAVRRAADFQWDRTTAAIETKMEQVLET